MNEPIVERAINCPYCGESIEIVLDLSAGGQSYIEDCQVCCQPIQLRFGVSREMLDSLSAERAD